MGAEEVSVAVSRSTETSLVRRAGKLEQAQSSSSLGVSLSLLADDRFSVHATSDLRPEALTAFLERAIAATKVLEPEPERRQPERERCGRGSTPEALDADDPAWSALPVEARRNHALQLEGAIDALPNRGRVLSASAYYGDSADETARVMSNGFEDLHRSTGFGIGVEITLEEPGGRRPEAMSWFSANHRSDLPNVEHVASEAWRKAEQRLASGPTASGKYPMLLENHAVGRILGAIGGPLSGSELHQQRSFLAGKIGEKIASEKLTILDDPTIPRGHGSRPYDGEGVVAKGMPIVENGILKNYYISTYYGRKLGMAPTTGGRSNWVVPAGERSVAEILADLPRCIVVTGFLGGNTNGLTGDFSFGIQGMLVENGAVVSNLSEMNVSGNLTDVLGRYVEGGNDVWKWSGLRAPSMLFDGIEFSGV